MDAFVRVFSYILGYVFGAAVCLVIYVLLGALSIQALVWLGILSTFSWKYALAVAAILFVISCVSGSNKSNK